jgi:uncharacterized protein YoaH (UPF0181 family)
MKQQINEIKRMQQLAGIIVENQINENIHNTPQMGGIFGGRNFAAEAEEDKKAVEDIKAAIANGASEEDAIEQVSKKYKLYSDYLKRKYDQSNKIKEAEKMNEAADYNKVDSILKGTYKRPVAEVDPEIKKMANVLDTLVSGPFGYEKLEDILNALGPIEPTALDKAIDMMKTSVFELNGGDPFYNLIVHSNKYTDKGVALSWEDDGTWRAG